MCHISLEKKGHPTSQKILKQDTSPAEILWRWSFPSKGIVLFLRGELFNFAGSILWSNMAFKVATKNSDPVDLSCKTFGWAILVITVYTVHIRIIYVIYTCILLCIYTLYIYYIYILYTLYLYIMYISCICHMYIFYVYIIIYIYIISYVYIICV